MLYLLSSIFFYDQIISAGTMTLVETLREVDCRVGCTTIRRVTFLQLTAGQVRDLNYSIPLHFVCEFFSKFAPPHIICVVT